MKKRRPLQFHCESCQQPVLFSVLELEKNEAKTRCPHCRLEYDFNDETLKRQIRKFEALCKQIHISEEILSHSAIAVSIGDREVKIPYKLLLTRLNSTLELKVGDRPLTITFRMEPLLEL